MFTNVAKVMLNFDEFFSDFRRVQKPDAHAAAPSKTRRPRCRAVPKVADCSTFRNAASSAALSLASSSARPPPTAALRDLPAGDEVVEELHLVGELPDRAVRGVGGRGLGSAHLGCK